MGCALGDCKGSQGVAAMGLDHPEVTVSRDVKFLESLYYKEWKQQQQKLPSTPLIVEADEVQQPSRQVEVAVSEEEMSGETEEGGAAEQTKGKDYDEVFAPVGKGTTLRVLLAIAALLGWKIRQMDIVTAFLNGIIMEEVYMKQPEGLDDGSGRVCRLKKAIYGLKQAPLGLEYSGVRQRLQRGAADVKSGEMLLSCYTDASFNSVKADGTSIGGYVCLLGGGAVSWRSKKQM
ncbi:hypothetical protein CLOM_g12807, partial [Closterium sp. NIES-68]